MGSVGIDMKKLSVTRSLGPFYVTEITLVVGLIGFSYYKFGGFDERTIGIMVVTTALIYMIHHMTFGRMDAKTKEILKFQRPFLNRARNVKSFPPPYPNTWYFVMQAEELKKGSVLPVQLLGRELVAFRNQKGQVGILDAWCPHLGAHLGHGGKVNSDGLLVCPFHEWKFDVEGKCRDIPYCTKEISGYSVIHNKGYPVVERYGMIFMWFHADNEPPRFDVDMHVIQEPCRPCDKLIRRGASTVFEMHMMEPSLNTQDWYHFGTTHANYPGFSPLKTYHTVRDVDFRDDGTFSFFEDMDTAFFNGPKSRVPGLMNKIKFCGPGIAVIVSQYKDMSSTTFATFTPIEPFKTKVDFTTFSTDGWFGFWKYASLLTGYTSEWTVKQDLQVWEHKTNPVPKRLVPGDRAGFNHYRKWLEQFYSESSDKQQTLEW